MSLIRFGKISRVIQAFGAFTACIGGVAGAAALHAPHWAAQRLPTPGPSDSIGRYAAGCLRGARALPAVGPGYRVVRRHRHRYFGHQSLLDFIRALGRQSLAQRLGTLLVADLSQPRGGPTPHGHRSHQNGLDVDIWFAFREELGAHELTRLDAADIAPPSVLSQGGRGLEPRRWNVRKVSLLRLAAEDPRVDRIFVNPVIKRALCAQSSPSPWLRKLRPWWGHADHLHVRLRCAQSERRCERSEPIPPGNGCDASLAWWFSAEAQAGGGGEPPLPLPRACAAVLQE
ncbi:MAG: penicillin-insensitive murein endopeptidase [Gammaproteobacteria bacterium]